MATMEWGHGGSNESNFVRTELFKLGVQWYDMRSYYAQGIRRQQMPY